MAPRYRHILGWFAVGLSTLAACFWGIIENFREGWYHPSLWMNLALMVVQYLLVTLLVVGAAVVAIRWPKIGGTVHLAAALEIGVRNRCQFIYLVIIELKNELKPISRSDRSGPVPSARR
jgi:hypothetical protein